MKGLYNMKNYKIVEETHEFNGKTMTDLVCYVKDHRFVLAPINTSKKARAYFYALLTNTERD